MKKILALLLAFAMLLSLGACTRRPTSTPDADQPQSGISSTQPDHSEEPSQSQPSPEQESQPSETPSQSTEPAVTEEPLESPEPSEDPVESPEPSEEPAESPEPSEEPAENPNEGKLDSTASVTTTATDLSPGDDSYLALIPELPYENWASTTVNANTIMLELNGLGADAMDKLLEYIQTLRDEDFEVTEYIYGALYEAKNDKVVINMMLDVGTFSVTIEKK